MKTLLVMVIVATAAIPAVSGSSDQPFAARVPSLGDAKVDCGLAKSLDFQEHIVVTKFDKDVVSYPFTAFAIVEYRGQFSEAQVPQGFPHFLEQTRKAKKVEIRLTMPDGRTILASEQAPPGRLGLLQMDDPNRRVSQLSFSYQFALDGMPSSFYRLDFFVDDVPICGGILNGSIWKRDEAQLEGK